MSFVEFCFCVPIPETRFNVESFRDFVRPLNKQFSKQLAHYADRFFTAQSQNGYVPYQVEYGIDAAALTPFYDELDGDQPCDTANPPAYRVPCTDMNDCLHPGQCNWPKCKFEYLTVDDSKNSGEADTPWAPLPAPLPEAPAIPSAKPEKTPETITANGIEPLPVPLGQPEGTGSFPAIPEAGNTISKSHSGQPVHPFPGNSSGNPDPLYTGNSIPATGKKPGQAAAA